MKRLVILLCVILPMSSSWAITVKCYMAGSTGYDQVVIASPKGLESMAEITAEIKQRYTDHAASAQKFGTISQIECVEFNSVFSSDIANVRFAELEY
ncbi:hypothetical protein [Agarivorans sp. Alg241-V36]|uniref:hypothetical protein n=1 Tax=Agarivorans sp. Alg241-V36 TaxID=2305992 RepID=UPI0013D79EFF|nr:hypothetical protein [Agarivorans sp. Alg241-V36]